MVFEFQVRGISKPDIQKLYKKYYKLFKKPDNAIENICELFLELIYLYFDNDKEKLYKLFFPVIMANFTEKGSIHSVIEECRESKNLYSWSYTYRILNKLDEDTGLEISRIFRKIKFKILKKLGFKNVIRSFSFESQNFLITRHHQTLAHRSWRDPSSLTNRLWKSRPWRQSFASLVSYLF